jgi:hypothetical protein
MLRIVAITTALLTTPALAAQIRTAECDGDALAECYQIMERSCPAGYSVVDKNTFYGDGIFRELPPRMVFYARQYATVLYKCS